jgi:ribonuclease HI
MTKALGHFDGCSLNNPHGPASCGYVIYLDKAEIEGGKYLGRATNNEAEFHGLIELMQKMHTLGITHPHIKGDSKLIINMAKGLWKAKEPRLQALLSQVKQLKKQFAKVKFTWVPREKNAMADTQAELALRPIESNETNTYEVLY